MTQTETAETAATRCVYHLGNRQYATWIAFTEAQRVEANRIMRLGTMAPSKALALAAKVK